MSDQAYFSRALLDAELAVPKELSSWNGSDPAVRFAVYRNNVVVSLIDALADSFPVTQTLVGEDFFRAMAHAFIQTKPVKTRVLTWLGASFADFLQAFPPVSSLPYLPDIARLEMHRVRAYHAADAAPIGMEKLALAMADISNLPELKLQLHPSVQLLESRYAAWSLWAAHQGILSIESVATESAESVLIYRHELAVEVLPLSSAEGCFVAQLRKNETLGNAADFADQAAAAAVLAQSFDLARILATLIRLQLITDTATQETSL